jgi:hypothetical protein
LERYLESSSSYYANLHFREVIAFITYTIDNEEKIRISNAGRQIILTNTLIIIVNLASTPPKMMKSEYILSFPDGRSYFAHHRQEV